MQLRGRAGKAVEKGGGGCSFPSFFLPSLPEGNFPRARERANGGGLADRSIIESESERAWAKDDDFPTAQKEFQNSPARINPRFSGVSSGELIMYQRDAAALGRNGQVLRKCRQMNFRVHLSFSDGFF